jgi:hypothetical protein
MMSFIRSHKFLIFCLSWLIISTTVYFSVNSKIGMPAQFQKVLTIERSSIYANLQGFQVKDNFIIADGKNPTLIFEINNQDQHYKYMSLFIDELNVKEEMTITPYAPDGTTSKNDYRVKIIKKGKQVIGFNKSNWSKFEIKFQENSDIVFSIDKILISQHKVAPAWFLYTFIAFIILLSLFLYLFLYRLINACAMRKL